MLILRFIRLAGAACGFMQSGSCASAARISPGPAALAQYRPASRRRLGAPAIAGRVNQARPRRRPDGRRVRQAARSPHRAAPFVQRGGARRGQSAARIFRRAIPVPVGSYFKRKRAGSMERAAATGVGVEVPPDGRATLRLDPRRRLRQAGESMAAGKTRRLLGWRRRIRDRL
jgi:hypothetical protein